jgi:hypothetical protein
VDYLGWRIPHVSDRLCGNVSGHGCMGLQERGVDRTFEGYFRVKGRHTRTSSLSTSESWRGDPTYCVRTLCWCHWSHRVIGTVWGKVGGPTAGAQWSKEPSRTVLNSRCNSMLPCQRWGILFLEVTDVVQTSERPFLVVFFEKCATHQWVLSRFVNL